MKQWFDIPSYEGIYQINVNGDIKSLERFVPESGKSGMLYKEKLLKPHLDKYGYLQVVLHKNGEAKTLKVHKLVAKQFISNPNNFSCINHKDENKENNNFENLEWCTIKYNNNYNNRQHKISEKRKKKIIQYDLNNNLVMIHNSLKDAEESINGYKGYIIDCCKGKKNSYKNYKWGYYEIS